MNESTPFRWSVLKYLVVFLFWVFPVRVYSQSVLWTQTNGPEGGAVSGMAVDSQGRLFIGTEAGGMFESIDDGATWIPRNGGLTSFHMREIESNSHGYIFATSYDGGIYRYFGDDLARWVFLDTTYFFGSINSIATTPNGDVFIATSRFGVLRSTNDGTSWERVKTGFDATDFDVRAMTASLGRLLALTSAQVTSEFHLYTSTDNGNSWSKLPLDSSGHTPECLLATPDGLLFYGDIAGNAFRSVDSGKSWNRIFLDSAHYGIANMVCSPANGHLFLRTDYGNLLISSNRGTSWKWIGEDSLGGSFFASIFNRSGTFFLGTDFEGILRSIDDGHSFEAINGHLLANLMYNISVDPQGRVFAITSDLVFRSGDRGETWKQLPLDLGENLFEPSIAIDSANAVFIGSILGIIYSRDSGETWSHAILPRIGSQANQCFGLTVGHGDTVWAATNTGLVFSANSGKTWLDAQPPLNGANLRGITMDPHGTLYADDVSENLYRSTDAGESWDAFAQGIGIQAVSPNGIFFGISKPYLFRSFDSARSWQELMVPDSLHRRTIFSVMYDSRNYLLACTDSGVYRSKDNGTTWDTVSTGLKDGSATKLSAVTHLAEDPKSGVFYAASRGQSVFRSLPHLEYAAVRETASVSSNNNLQNYPNPFSTSTLVSFRLTSFGDAHLELCDILGNIMWSKDLRQLQPGEYSEPIVDPNLESGTYICRLRTGTEISTKFMTVVR